MNNLPCPSPEASSWLKKRHRASAALRTCVPTGMHFTQLPGEALQPPRQTDADTPGGCQAAVPLSHIMGPEAQVQLLAHPCQAFCSLLGALPDTLTSVLWAQVVSALSSPKIGPRNPGAWHEVSCHSGLWGTQKVALPDEPDPDFDPNTILQTQDRLSQDYEGLRAQAEVTLLVHGTFTPSVWILGHEPRDRAVTGRVPCP